MTLVFIILIGGLVGWLASPAVRDDLEEESIPNIALGIVGALLGGFALTPLLGSAPISNDRLSPEAFLVALFGATLVVAIAAVRRRNRMLQRRMNPPTSRNAKTTSTKPTIST